VEREALLIKAHSLIDWFSGYPGVVVCYSGGVDSTLVLFAAHLSEAERVIAFQGVAESFPIWDRDFAHRFIRDHGIERVMVRTRELSDPRYRDNPPERCYFCKLELYSRAAEFALPLGYVVVDGTNRSDLSDYRPGLRAARELGVRSPLVELGIDKQEVRELSRLLGLPQWDRPASPCLASRIAYGLRVTPERLARVEQAELILREEGFVLCRVRDLGKQALIQVERSQVPRLEKLLRGGLADRLLALGFEAVAADPQGYRRGSLAELLLEGKDRINTSQ